METINPSTSSIIIQNTAKFRAKRQEAGASYMMIIIGMCKIKWHKKSTAKNLKHKY